MAVCGFSLFKTSARAVASSWYSTSSEICADFEKAGSQAQLELLMARLLNVGIAVCEILTFAKSELRSQVQLIVYQLLLSGLIIFIHMILRRAVGITRLCSAADGSWTGSDRIFCSLSIYGSVWNCFAKVQDFALTIYPIFTYFTCYQVEIHGAARPSDVLRVTFACKRVYFLQELPYKKTKYIAGVY